ncbi:MAG: undecaprenyl-diphosphate phosphatase [Endomicrobiia bacterium]|nr:undecaprenyl-diphosphate phosphatase [Endomicrobiia bacterium]
MNASLPSLSFLGIVQGLTEFLPVSSSGHLALLGAFFRLGDSSFAVSIALHLATMAAVMVFFRRRIAEAAMSPRAWLLVAAASLPTTLIGLVLKSKAEEIFAGRVSWVYFLMAATGAMLFAVSGRNDERAKPDDNPSRPSVGHDEMWRRITVPQAMAVGVAQGVAALPGISRSGSTICAALALGLSGKDAAAFSFIISIPAVSGAAFLELRDLVKSAAPLEGVSYVGLAVSMALAFAVGLLAIGFLIKVIAARKLKYFSYYLWAVAAAGLIFNL